MHPRSILGYAHARHDRTETLPKIKGSFRVHCYPNCYRTRRDEPVRKRTANDVRTEESRQRGPLMDSPGAVRIATNACRVRCFQPLSHLSMAGEPMVNWT